MGLQRAQGAIKIGYFIRKCEHTVLKNLNAIDFRTITILSNENTQRSPPLHMAEQANIIRASFMRIVVESSV